MEDGFGASRASHHSQDALCLLCMDPDGSSHLLLHRLRHASANTIIDSISGTDSTTNHLVMCMVSYYSSHKGTNTAFVFTQY